MRDWFSEGFPSCAMEERVVSGAQARRLEEWFLPRGTTLIAIGEEERRAFFDAPSGGWEWLRVTGGDYMQTLSRLKKLTPAGAGARLRGLMRLTVPEDFRLDRAEELADTVLSRMGEGPSLAVAIDTQPDDRLQIALLLRENGPVGRPAGA